MRWFRVPKEVSVQPVSGHYRDWKQQLAVEGCRQCVYCAIHESAFGGFRNFHVEHYRPKRSFPELEDDYQNLFYACGICNVFKGADWPADPTEALDQPAYPSPSEIDYCEILSTDETTGEVRANCVAGNYLVQKIYLNRPQLLVERRLAAVRSRVDSARLAIQARLRVVEALPSEVPKELVVQLSQLLADIVGYLRAIEAEPPYEPDEVRR